jgi:CRISPR-associated protein (TIGR03984 family)
VSDTLYRATTVGVSLPDALKALGGRAAVALLYAPGWCRFGRVDEAGLFTGPPGEPLLLAEVYEARAFHEAAELRWWNDPVAGQHRAALLAGQPITPDGWQGGATRMTVIDTIEQTYLLWGKAGGASPGWTTLTAARIGRLDVPTAGGPRVVVRAREYLQQFDDGNVAVAEERLLAVEPYEPEERGP